MVRRLGVVLILAAIGCGCAKAKVKPVEIVVPVETSVADVTTVERGEELAVGGGLIDNGGLVGHIVVPGESLWYIDREYGGDGLGWYGIWSANLDVVKDPDLIYPGQYLEFYQTDQLDMGYRRIAGDRK